MPTELHSRPFHPCGEELAPLNTRGRRNKKQGASLTAACQVDPSAAEPGVRRLLAPAERAFQHTHFRTGGQENPAGSRGSGFPGVSTQLAARAEFRYQPRGEAHRSPPTLKTNASCQTCARETTGTHLCLSGSTTEGLIFTWE